MSGYGYSYKFDDAKLAEYINPELNQAAPGDGDFLEIGKHFASLFVEKCGLKAGQRVLDVGCSTGRNAIPLTQIIGKNGEYQGFDIVPASIDWAKKNITAKNPNFKFKLVDVFNAPYNPSGMIKPTEFSFPYDWNRFDLVFLVSVFTHMQPPDVELYIKEIARVTKPGGFVFCTYFLLTDKVVDYMNNGRADRRFSEGGDPVAYSKSSVEEMYAKNKLEIVEVLPGWWSGEENPTSYQDIVIARKK